MNNREISIATGASRMSKRWQTSRIGWCDFAARLGQPQVSVETMAEYRKMPKSEKDDLKDVGGFVGGSLSGEQRTTRNVVSRDLITLDADNIPAGGTETVISTVKALNVNAVVYSTWKHTPESPRLRIVVPLDRPCTPEQYAPIARALCSWIWPDMAIFDRTTFDVARMMYYPSTCADGKFVYENITYEDSYLSTDYVLNAYTDWTNPDLWPRIPDEDKLVVKRVDGKKLPSELPGIIGAFCAIYDVPAAIDEFIPDVYVPAGENRYTFATAQTTAGAILYENGQFIYSNHASDPACGQLCNSFDIVRIHLFGEEDDLTKDIPLSQRPSQKKMLDLRTRSRKYVQSVSRVCSQRMYRSTMRQWPQRRR